MVKRRRALCMILYGPSGVGKTCLAAHFPGVGFIIDPQEKGILDLIEYAQVPKTVKVLACPTTWNEALEAIDAAASSGIKTLAIDSLTGIEQLCFQHHCQEHFDNDWSTKGFFAYQQGPVNAAKTIWRDFVGLIDAIQEAGINVILIAHSNIKDRPNPSGISVIAYTPYMHKETWGAIGRTVQAILFANYEFDVEKRGIRTVPDPSSERRVIYTEWSAVADAKNRFGLSPVIDMGGSGSEAYTNFRKAMREAIRTSES